jgi:hypothetical protein
VPAHERLLVLVVERAREDSDVVHRAAAPEHDGRVALEAPQLRALHWRPLERSPELGCDMPNKSRAI